MLIAIITIAFASFALFFGCFGGMFSKETFLGKLYSGCRAAVLPNKGKRQSSKSFFSNIVVYFFILLLIGSFVLFISSLFPFSFSLRVSRGEDGEEGDDDISSTFETLTYQFFPLTSDVPHIFPIYLLPLPLIAFIVVARSYYLLYTTDPGTIMPGEDHTEYPHQGVMYASDDVCLKCSLPGPPRSHHCRSCGRCVEVFDHHCVWIGGDVGLHNYWYFFAFLHTIAVSLLLLGFIYHLPTLLVWKHAPGLGFMRFVWFVDQVPMLFIGEFAFVVIGFAMVLFCGMHWKVLLTNTPTYEGFLRKAIRSDLRKGQAFLVRDKKSGEVMRVDEQWPFGAKEISLRHHITGKKQKFRVIPQEEAVEMAGVNLYRTGVLESIRKMRQAAWRVKNRYPPSTESQESDE